jgi:YVTN family beta-propeller protein
VINTASGAVSGPISVGAGPVAIALTPDGSRAYVANSGSNTVSVITTANNTVTGSPIPVGFTPVAIAITPDGTHAYVANEISLGNRHGQQYNCRQSDWARRRAFRDRHHAGTGQRPM